MLRRFAVVFAVTALIAGSILPAGAGGRATDLPAAAQPEHDYVMVKLADPPTASYTGGIPGLARTKPLPGQKLNLTSDAARKYRDYLASKRQDYRAFLQSKAPRAQVVREYSVVQNGLAIKLNGESAQALSAGPGVARVERSFLVRPAMNISPALIGATQVWRALGGVRRAGEGIKVGIIDTGIDITHSFFNDKGYTDVAEVDACAPLLKPGGKNTNDKVFICRVYASGVAPGASAPSVLLAFDHGTHVGGTVAGNNNTSGVVAGTSVTLSDLSGIAPRARLGDYNVFPGFGAGFIAFGGSAFSHDIAAALEDAVADGMDVVNMSLGGGVQGPHDFLAEATNATVDANVIAAVAAGNEGPGDSTVSSPGSAEKALTAGASTNPHFVGIPVRVNSSTFGAAIGDFNPYVPAVSGVLLDWNAIDGSGTGLACTAVSGAPAAGKIAVIRRGLCTFSTKIRNAQNTGAVGVLIVNSVAGDPVAMAQDGTANQPTIAAAMVAKNDGPALLAAAAANQTATGDGTKPQEFVTSNADIIAGFSSRGPTPFTYLIKPDVTGPGVNVASSVFDNEIAFFQGTSMSTPHVAGSAALLLALNPGWSPADVKSALVNTAKRPVFDFVTGTNPAGTEPGVVGSEALARGGGRIDLVAASRTPMTIDPASVSFGFWGGNKDVKATKTLAIKNVSGTTQACSVAVTGSALVSAPGMLSVPTGGATLTVTLDAGRADQTGSGDRSGDVVLDCNGGTLRIPWWVRVDRGP